MMEPAPIDARPSPIAGRWYSGDPETLAKSIDDYLSAASLPEIDGEVVAVIAPHAGHLYSGAVAGCAFASVRGMAFDLAVVVAPMHHPYHQPLLTTSHDAYQTPLSDVMVDRDAVVRLDKALQQKLGFGLSAVRRDTEHSLEIELPFLQRALAPGFKLLPVMVRDQRVEVARALGSALAETVSDRRALLVASSDLSHFYPQAVAERLDKVVLDQIEAFNPEEVIRAEDEGKGFACGKGAIAAVMWAARELGANHAQVLKHATSGDITGDTSGVVGYGAAVLTRR